MGTAASCPVHGGVLISGGLNVHMSMQGMSNGAEQWCPVKEMSASKRQRCPLTVASPCADT